MLNLKRAVLVMPTAFLIAVVIAACSRPVILDDDRDARYLQAVNPLQFGIVSVVSGSDGSIERRESGLRDRGQPDVFARGATYGVPEVDVATRLDRGVAHVNSDTIFDIGSISKQFTAALILLLEQDGKLSLSDSVAKYLPALHAVRKVTIYDLLHQQSGISEYNDFPKFTQTYLAVRRSKPYNYDFLLKRLGSEPLAFPPGSEYEYSGTNYALLALIVEKISGTHLSSYLQRRILAPLSMTRTRQGLPPSGTQNVAIGFTLDSGVVKRAHQWDLEWLAGAGGMTSTANDLIKWDAAIARPGRLLGQRAFREFFAGSVRPIGRTHDQHYASGWVVTRLDGRAFVWHNGGVGGYRAMNALFPDTGLAIVVLSNGEQVSVDDIAEQLFEWHARIHG
jgi:CubicO group peptidase (beta-lactamase class C family)